jgi:hypothetical protein
MNDDELRRLLLFLHNILRNHLIQTGKLESAVEMLLDRDPVAKARYEEKERKERAAMNQDDASVLWSTAEMLLELGREIAKLTPKNRKELGC